MKVPNRTYKGDYIKGQFVAVKDPNGEVLSKNPGNLEDPAIPLPFSYEHVHDAVLAAKRTFTSWRRISVQDRFTALVRYKETLKARAEELASIISCEIGKPLWECRLEVATTLDLIDYFIHAGSQTSVELQIPDAAQECTGKVRFLPRGVMAVISPATQPVLTPHSHFVPALINGNTVVLKASKYAPFVGQFVAELIHDSGLPAGALNVIQGNSEAGRRLVSESEVDGVLYTGNYETAEKIRKQLLADYWKMFVLDTGGKNGCLIWNDCDYSKAVHEAVFAAFATAGQRCTTTSRILIHDHLFDRFLTDFHSLAKKLPVGYGMTDGDKSPFMGPLISEAALEDYLRFQGIAVREGAEEIMRGKTLEREKKGYYVSPSIHLVEKADPKSMYQKSEFHGPNVALYRVKDLDEAVGIFNQTQHGLVASVYSGARENYVYLTEEVRVGLLHWNRPTTHVSFKLPYGGIKKSGNSRPMGSYSGYQCTYPLSCIEAPVSLAIEDLPKELPRLH